MDPLELNILESAFTRGCTLSFLKPWGYLKEMLFNLFIVAHIFTSLVTLELGSVTALLVSSPCLFWTTFCEQQPSILPLPLFGWYVCNRGLFQKSCLLPIVVKTSLDFCLLLAVFTRSVSNFSPNKWFSLSKISFFSFNFFCFSGVSSYLFQNIKTPGVRNIIVGLT